MKLRIDGGSATIKNVGAFIENRDIILRFRLTDITITLAKLY